ncbi:hypothetical protein APHAL10511_005059 [Amanita phalloides]|nr:hypothetical protein APHAL10511_005059 [Amanita phalloides]
MTVSAVAAAVYDDDDWDADDFVLVERGLMSTVRKTRRMGFGDNPGVWQWIAVKTATTNRRFSKQPHDVIKELRLLASLSHLNVIQLFDHTHDQSSMHLWMPFIPLSFDCVLNSPSFSPSNLTSGFLVLAKSLTFQIISAIAYLHSPPQSIAHRDIKPRNVLLTEYGCAKLIDFGISWKSDETEEQKQFDLWPEGSEEMCTAVSTGPYRSPELLFGPKSYNAFATDLWSLGATLAELFTPLELIRSSSSTPSDSDTNSSAESEQADLSSEPRPFIVPPKARNALDEHDDEWKWVRKSLFDGTRGELGLLWSIFKTMGTPNDQTWPGFKTLSDARSVSFNQVPAVPLDSKFPNLPPPTHPDMRSHALDFISKLLVYPPEDRLHAQDALSHPFLTCDEVPLLLPPNYAQLREGQDHLETQVVFNWEGMSLGDLLKQILASGGQQSDEGE